VEIRLASSPAPAVQGIPLCEPEIGGNEWTYVKDCLDTGWVSSAGAYVDRFEGMLAEAVGTDFAVATVNGTSALHLALRVAGVQTDDEVVTSALTFIAPANAIRYVGAWPVFVDAEPQYWQMDVGRVAAFLQRDCRRDGGIIRNVRTGRRVRAILPVHILGHPVDMGPLLVLAREYGLVVIEDATESLGAQYNGRPVGQLGDVACFSFNGNKLVTTGGGGMLVTDREDWARRARYLSTQAKDDAVEYIHQEIGYNYRLTNVQAAIGVAQLERLAERVAVKRAIARRYDAALSAVPGIRRMRQAPWAESVYWMYTIRVDVAAFGMGSRELMRHLAQRGIQTRPLWQPLHLSPAHRWAQAEGGAEAARLNREALSLPCSVGLSEEQQTRVIQDIVHLAGRRTAGAS
jgi:perosamine synthetase